MLHEGNCLLEAAMGEEENTGFCLNDQSTE